MHFGKRWLQACTKTDMGYSQVESDVAVAPSSSSSSGGGCRCPSAIAATPTPTAATGGWAPAAASTDA